MSEAAALAVAFAVVNVIQLMLVEALRSFPPLQWMSRRAFEAGVSRHTAVEVRNFFIDGTDLTGLTGAAKDAYLNDRREAALRIAEIASSAISLVVGFLVSIIALLLASFVIGRSQAHWGWSLGAIVAAILGLFFLILLIYQVANGKFRDIPSGTLPSNLISRVARTIRDLSNPLVYQVIVILSNAYVILLSLIVSL